MTFPELPRERFMAGGAIGRVWRDFYQGIGGIRMDPHKGRLPYGTACPAHSCHQCVNPNCLYADFIRQYVGYPKCD